MLIALDTNVLLDQAAGTEDVLDAIGTIRRRLSGASFIVTQTVLGELAWAADNGDAEESALAIIALARLNDWGYQAVDVIPVGRGIVEQISLKLRGKGVFPHEEENDASIAAEAALLGCTILLSSDAHLLDAQEHPGFRSVLKESDVGEALVIARPKTIAMKFSNR